MNLNYQIQKYNNRMINKKLQWNKKHKLILRIDLNSLKIFLNKKVKICENILKYF